MTNYLFTGGGTAGHVNPLLTVARAIEARGNQEKVFVLGTMAGLETKLVPEAGFELLTIEKVPFPRRVGLWALVFPFKFLKAVRTVERIIVDRKIDAVVGFGGYVSAPAYLAAKRKRIPLILHEANALPGIANRFGNRFASAAAVAFRTTPLANADFVGMPLRTEITDLANKRDKKAARLFFGLKPDLFTLLVTGGSLGSRSINEVIDQAKSLFAAAGIQLIHIIGNASSLTELDEPEYKRVRYVEKMEMAIAASDFAVSRAGAATVSEFSAIGLPALYIPYPVGNGEQKHNVQDLVAAGGGMMLEDKEFSLEYVRSKLISILSDTKRLDEMSKLAKESGVLDGTSRFIKIIDEVLSRR